MDEQQTMSEQQAEDILRGFAEEKLSVPSFFKNVVESDDNSKTGNLTIEELGLPSLQVRTSKELELFCRDVYNDDVFANYWQKKAELDFATSLSKDAILLKLLVTKKNEVADITPRQKENSGWFKKKEDKNNNA